QKRSLKTTRQLCQRAGRHRPLVTRVVSRQEVCSRSRTSWQPTTMEVAMPGARVEVTLTEEEREVLERWARRPKSSQALALRCRIVLAAADGEPSVDIAERLGVNPS